MDRSSTWEPGVSCRSGAKGSVLHSATRNFRLHGQPGPIEHRDLMPRFGSGTWRKGHYGSQPEGVRASIDKKAGKLQNYRSVCPSVDGRSFCGAVRRWAAARFRSILAQKS